MNVKEKLNFREITAEVIASLKVKDVDKEIEALSDQQIQFFKEQAHLDESLKDGYQALLKELQEH